MYNDFNIKYRGCCCTFEMLQIVKLFFFVDLMFEQATMSDGDGKELPQQVANESANEGDADNSTASDLVCIPSTNAVAHANAFLVILFYKAVVIGISHVVA